MSRLPPPVLETARLRLRGYEAADAGALHSAFGDPVSMRYWDSGPASGVGETARRLRFALQPSALRYAVWTIARRTDGEVVGLINYHHREPGQHRMELGWMLVPAHARQGYMTEAARGLIGHCINRLKVHRFEAMIEPGNVASQSLALRLGFVCESGALRDRNQVDGTYRSVLLYGLLAEDFR